VTKTILQANPRLPRLLGSIEFRGEAFLKTSQGYQPFTYLDTVIKSPSSVRNMAIFRLPDVFFNFIHKIATMNEAIVLKRNVSYTFQVLDSLNKERFKLSDGYSPGIKKRRVCQCR
jgi:hypothetical protein